METAHSFWFFAHSLYEQPPVAKHCLWLQDEYDIDVLALLFFCWLGREQGSLDSRAINNLSNRCHEWSDRMIKPLRSTRRWMKTVDDELCNRQPRAFESLREQIKIQELAAEKLVAETLACAWQSAQLQGKPGPQALEHNTARYLESRGITLTGEGHDRLASILTAACTLNN